MSESPIEILSRVARIPEAERRARRSELKALLEPRLESLIHRHVLGCLVGEPTRSRIARAWAVALIAEVRKRPDDAPER